MQRRSATRASMGFGGEWYRLVPLFFAFCGETSRSRYHSLENQSVKLRGLGQSPRALLVCTGLSGKQPVGRAAHIKDMGAEGQPVDQCRNQGVVLEQFRPTGERQIGGDDGTGSFAAIRDDLEEQLR